jgi:hypothetical protein
MDDDDAALTPLEAASALREVAGWSGSLRAKTEGLTWIFWGVVAPAIFLTYALAATLAPDAPWTGLLWLPWASLGLLFTALLWRSTRVAASRPTVSARELAVHAGLFLLAMAGAVVLVFAARVPLAPTTAVGAGLGLLVAMLGVREAAAPAGGSRALGLVQILGGVALVGFAVSEALALAGEPAEAALRDSALGHAAASAVVLVVIGALRYATRG